MKISCMVTKIRQLEIEMQLMEIKIQVLVTTTKQLATIIYFQETLTSLKEPTMLSKAVITQQWVTVIL